MTWVDLAVIGVLVVSALLAFMRGLVRELLGIGAWVGAGAAAVWGLPFVRGHVRQWITEPVWVDPISFLLIFTVVLIILMLIARFVGRVVRRSPLGGVDRSLGLVFGLARGALIVILAYIIGGLAVQPEHWPVPVKEALLLNPTYKGAEQAVRLLPAGYRPKLYPPPPGRQTTAEALLRANPQGRAVGRQPLRE